MRKSTLVKLLLLFLVLGGPQTSAVILPADRMMDWQTFCGIPGGIPNRTTIFATVTQAPYSADPTGNLDALNSIQTAINSAPTNTVVMIPTGKFKLNSTLRMKEGVTVRGAGMTNTLLLINHGSEAGIEWDSSINSAIVQGITAGMTRGSSSITVANAGSIQVGQHLYVDQDNDLTWVNPFGNEGPATLPDPVYSRAAGAYTEVTGKSGNILTINPPFPWDFTSGKNPKVNIEVDSGNKSMIRMAGLESLTVTNNWTGQNGVEKMVRMRRAAYCWMQNVEIRRSKNQAVNLQKAFRSQVEGCTFHGLAEQAGTWAGSSSAYCVQGDYKASYNIIQNNIAVRLLGICTLEYGMYGNVIAYNFVTNAVYGQLSPPDSWMGADMSTHALHEGYQLFEGNIVDMWAPDFIHGSSSHLLAVRNHMRGIRPNTSLHNRCIEIDAWNRYSSAVGNVLGGSQYGWTSQHKYSSQGSQTFDGGETKCIYRIGYPMVNYTGSGYDNGMLTGSTYFIRHGNWDSVTGSVIWDAAISDHELPNSFYLAGKPAWWGANHRWPPIGSDLSPMVAMNPAMRRWLGISEGEAPPPPQTRTITIESVNPNSGVTIFASPVDLSEAGPPPTPFTRLYNDGTAAFLTAPATANGNNFLKWQKNGVDSTTNARIDYIANSADTYTAVYQSPAPPVTFQISITSVTPNTGVAILATIDNNGNSDGTTPFARIYPTGAAVTFVAPATASGQNFVQWNKNGGLYSTSRGFTFEIGAAETFTAVYSSAPPPVVPPTGNPTLFNVYTIQ
jgi:hypothetical protein